MFSQTVLCFGEAYCVFEKCVVFDLYGGHRKFHYLPNSFMINTCFSLITLTNMLLTESFTMP